jgi:hypothetical protein
MTKKTLVDTTQRRLETKIAEVTNELLEGLETARRDYFKTQLAEVEVRSAREFSDKSITKSQAKQGPCQRTGVGACMVQTPNFEGCNSWTVSDTSSRP